MASFGFGETRMVSKTINVPAKGAPTKTDRVSNAAPEIGPGTPLLDLKYDEDSRAEVDMNIVCTGDGRFIELQGTAEREPFSQAQMDELVALGVRGIEELIGIQKAIIAELQ